jgi:hypothetical protein
MDTQLVDFESFFNQLIPLTEQDHRIMYGMTTMQPPQGSFFASDSSFAPITDINPASLPPGQFLSGSSANFASEVVVKQEPKSKGN